jgi:hypothetical protein
LKGEADGSIIVQAGNDGDTGTKMAEHVPEAGRSERGLSIVRDDLDPAAPHRAILL